MMIDAFPPYVSPSQRIKLATSDWERQGAHDLRIRVFCREQSIFEDNDRDAIDDIAHPIVALSNQWGLDDTVVGTVRIHPDDDQPNVWWGSRLAVCPIYRRHAKLGAALIRHAVTTANAWGCQRFYAHVQKRNAVLFRRMRWTAIEDIDLHGHPHVLMEADMDHYPPAVEPTSGFVTQLSRAA